MATEHILGSLPHQKERRLISSTIAYFRVGSLRVNMEGDSKQRLGWVCAQLFLSLLFINSRNIKWLSRGRNQVSEDSALAFLWLRVFRLHLNSFPLSPGRRLTCRRELSTSKAFSSETANRWWLQKARIRGRFPETVCEHLKSRCCSTSLRGPYQHLSLPDPFALRCLGKVFYVCKPSHVEKVLH